MIKDQFGCVNTRQIQFSDFYKTWNETIKIIEKFQFVSIFNGRIDGEISFSLFTVPCRTKNISDQLINLLYKMSVQKNTQLIINLDKSLKAEDRRLLVNLFRS